MKHIHRLLLSWIVCSLLCIAQAGALHAAEQQDNFLIIKAYSGKTLINSGLEALYQANQLFIPIDYLADDLDVPITYNEQTHQLTGWLESESNTVRVDFDTLSGRVGKNMFDFSPQDFIYYDGQLFISTTLVDKILSTHSDFDFSNQSLRVTTAGNLPFEKELSRHEKQARFDQRQQEQEAARLAQVNKQVYMQKDWLQMPFFDLSARYSLSKNKGQSTQQNLGYSATASFLTGGFDSEINAYSSTDEQAPIISLKTRRIDESGHILGLFKQLEIGDTYAFSTPENDGSPMGWGIKMSTESALEPAGKTYTIRDTLPLGWEVELYRNQELLGYRNQSQDGFFEFTDIPLLLGKNVFKIVFYGPNGQVKEKEEVIFFNGNMLDQGKGRLRLNYINKNRYLIETRDRPRKTSLGHNASVSAGYGLTNNITLNASAIADSLELYLDYPPGSMYRKDKAFAAGDISIFAYGIYSSIGTVVDFEEKAATLDYYGQTSLWNWDITLEHTYFGDAITTRNLLNDSYMKDETTLRLNKTLKLSPFFTFPVSYTFHHFSVVDSDKTQTEHTLSVSQNLPYNIYLNATYQNSEWFTGNRSERLTLNANHVRGPWTARASSGYDFVYDRFPSAELSLYRNITRRLKGGVKYSYVSRNLSTHSYESLYAANLSWQTKYGYLSFEAGTSSRHNNYAFVGYNVSLLPDWRNRALYSSSNKLYGTGALSARAFMDTNSNGMWDEDEMVLPESEFTVTPRVNVLDSRNKTSKGSTVLTHVPAYRPIDITADTRHIEETLSLLNTSGVQTVMLRPAQVAYIDFPIVATGDIEGTVYQITAEGKRVPAKGMIVNLYQNDTLVSNKISEFDGYYSFPQVPLGTYTLRLDPTQAAELELKQQKEISIALKEIEQLEVRDMVLQPKRTVKRSATPKRKQTRTRAANTRTKTANQPQSTSTVTTATSAAPASTAKAQQTPKRNTNARPKQTAPQTDTQDDSWRDAFKQKMHAYYVRYQGYKQKILKRMFH